MSERASHNSLVSSEISALLRRDELFRALFESSADALLISVDDDKSVVIECNERATSLFNAPDKATVLRILDGSMRVKPLTPEDLRRRTEELIKEGSVYTEVEYRSFTGRVFWAAHLVQRITVGGQHLRLTRITDISDRKAAENELRRQKAIFEDAERIAEIGSWEFNLQTQEITWSKEVFRLFGMEPQDKAPSFAEYQELISEESRGRLQTLINNAVQKGEPYTVESRVVGKDGIVRYHEGRGKPIKDDNGNITKLVGTLRNITDRVLRTKALEESETRLRGIIDNTNAVIVTFSLNGTITFVSNNVNSALGYQTDDVLGLNFAALVHAEELLQTIDLVRKGIAGEIDTANMDVRFRTKDDVWLWFNVMTSIVRPNDGTEPYFVSIATNIEQQKQLQAKLRRSEESLAEAQKMAHLGSWSVDVQTLRVEWSDEMFRIFGMPIGSQPLGIQEFLAITHDDDKERVRLGIKRSLKDKEMTEEELRIFRNGSLRWLEARVKPVLNKQGDVTALLGTIWDITERKIIEQQIRALNLTLEERVMERTAQFEEANRQLRSSQGNLKTLIESTNDAIWSIDREYRLTAMNASFYSLLTIYNDYHEPQLGQNVCGIVPGAGEQEWRALYDQALAGQRFGTYLSYELSDLHFDIEISLNPIADESSEIVGVVMFARDISERLQKERELKEREELLQLIFDAVPTGISLTDKNGRYTRVNQAFASMMQYAVEDLQGKSFADFVPSEQKDSLIASYREFFDNDREGVPNETMLLRKDGETVPVWYASSLFRSVNGQKFAITTVSDITLRKKAEDEIRRALEQERELGLLKSRFVVMVSHEFRTPLTTIRASAQIMQRLRERMTWEKQSEYLQDIQQAVDTMSHLMEDVLYLGKADAKGLEPHFAPLNFSALCESIINGFEVNLEYADRVIAHIAGIIPPKLMLDEKLLRQILTNLLSNALKYSPPSRPVELSLQFIPDDDGESGDNAQRDGKTGKPKGETVSRQGKTGLLRISVKDNGIGISEEDISRLFEPFYRASNVGNTSGTGLGLTIVKLAVEACGGLITCQSILNAGTEFIVVIPCEVADVFVDVLVEEQA